MATSLLINSPFMSRQLALRLARPPTHLHSILRHSPSRISAHALRSYSSRRDEDENTSVIGKFVETIKVQYKKNKELNQNLKQLQEEAGKVGDSDALRKAKELYAKAKDTPNLPGAQTLKKAASTVGKVAESAGQKISDTVKEASQTEFAKASKEKLHKASEKISSATEPIRQNPVYSTVRDEVATFVEEGSSRYGGYRDKQTRRAKRGIVEDVEVSKKDPEGAEKANQTAEGGETTTGAEDAAKKPQATKARIVEENVNAGASVVLHKDSKWKESWKNFKENSPFMQSVFNAKRAMNDSDHPVLNYSRLVYGRVSDIFGGLFEENEQAQAVALLRETVDPKFNVEGFMKEAREYIVPELIDAYLKGDTATLREWCSEATFNVLTAGIKAQQLQGLVSDCKIRDLRHVELVAAKVLDNDVPVLVVSFSTQEIILFRDQKTGEIKFGREDHIEACRYAIVVTKTEEDLQNPITSGWRIMDMAKHESRPIW